jgi:hypothetical protein
MKMLSPHKLRAAFDNSPKLLQDAMRRCGQPVPSASSISNWSSRGSIPSHWTGAVLWTCLQHDIGVGLLLDDLHVGTPA